MVYTKKGLCLGLKYSFASRSFLITLLVLKILTLSIHMFKKLKTLYSCFIGEQENQTTAATI
jgi:hypothetical protein